MSQRVQIVKYAELVPCRTAFIDAHTPGSDQKENFTIIGGGVSESADQHVHIKDTPGFNIGAAGQSPKCRNSLHTHRTAEVFFVLSGRWRFFWGRWGDAGEVILEPGDIFNIPTGMFRGFENIGSDYGMIMAILGGDDAGGGVVWAPQVIEDAHDHGLILGENGKLYDRKKGEGLPANIAPMPVMTDDNLSMMAEPSVDEVVPRWVARYLDLLALSRDKPVQVIGEQGLIFDKPGFEVEFVTAPSAAPVSAESHYTVLMPVKGFWRLHQNGEDSHIGPGDTAFLQPDTSYELASAMSGEAGLYRIKDTNDPAGPSWWERN
ncbi:MAG: cupin domain-containing protein [Candidatus Puniceispirillaceae bacterium]